MPSTIQVLDIERRFLSNVDVAQALNLSAIRSLQRTIENGQKKKFIQSLELSAHVGRAFEWFGKPETKALLQDEGISWTAEQFSLKVFGWQKSYAYKLVKVSKLESSVIDSFTEACDRAEGEGEQPIRSIESLLKYAKGLQATQGGQAGGEGGQGEGEGEEGEGGQDTTAVQTRPRCILTLAYKTEAGNVAVRVDSEGNVNTNNTEDELRQAIELLQECLQRHFAQSQSAN